MEKVRSELFRDRLERIASAVSARWTSLLGAVIVAMVKVFGYHDGVPTEKCIDLLMSKFRSGSAVFERKAVGVAG